MVDLRSYIIVDLDLLVDLDLDQSACTDTMSK